MKVLPTTKINSVSADTEDTNYPAANVLNAHPKKIAKASSGETLTMTFNVGGSGDWLGLVNTNARVVTVKVYDVPADQIALETDLLGADTDLFGDDDDPFVTYPVYEGTFSLGGIDTYAELIVGEGQAAYELDVPYPYQMKEHSIVIELDTQTTGLVPHIGCALAGMHKASTFDTVKGLQEGLVDYSIVKELSNGATYVKMRDIVRTFSATVFVERDREFYDFMHGVAREIGQQARLWRITDLENNDWVVFARLKSMPVATHSTAGISTMKFTWVEEL